VALGLALVLANPEIALVAMAYAYLASGFIGLVWNRLRRRHPEDALPEAEGAQGDASHH
jgi:hypothetical protein